MDIFTVTFFLSLGCLICTIFGQFDSQRKWHFVTWSSMILGALFINSLLGVVIYSFGCISALLMPISRFVWLKQKN